MKKSPKLPLWQSVFWIVGSIFVVTGATYKLLHSDVLTKSKKNKPSKQMISYIVQTGLQKEALHSDYLAEILGLSSDRPITFDSFKEEDFQKKLLLSPVIQKARIKKLPPNMVYVDYTVRKPIGWAADFVNTAIDREGYLFPVYPFFSPKKLPEIYLGAEGIKESSLDQKVSFDRPLQSKYIDLALQIHLLLEDYGKDLFHVKKIDVSHAFASTLGKREIVLTIENTLQEGLSTHFLRLSSKQFTKELANYLSLRAHLLEAESKEKGTLKEKVIDLRLSQLAFIK